MNAKNQNKEVQEATKAMQEIAKGTIENLQNAASGIVETALEEIKKAGESKKEGLTGDTFINWLKQVLCYPGDEKAKEILEAKAKMDKAEKERLAKIAKKAKENK